jgi:hypothetical protein
VVARRSGARWFVGGTYAGAARTAALPLRIGGGIWLVETVMDGPAGLVRTAKAVRGGATLEVAVAADGGFAPQGPLGPGDRRFPCGAEGTHVQEADTNAWTVTLRSRIGARRTADSTAIDVAARWGFAARG